MECQPRLACGSIGDHRHKELTSGSHQTQDHHVRGQMSPGLVAERATKNTQSTWIERNDNEEAVEQFP